MHRVQLGRHGERRVLLAWALLVASLCGAPSLASDLHKKNGYAVGADQCGTGDLSFPRLQIDMKEGLCAGLVAGAEDGLKFPRSIIQLPGHELFVVADMGGWGHTDGRLLVLDPRAAEGRRIREVLTGLEYPFGLAVGPDKKVYASTAETIFRLDPLADNPRATVETIIRRLPGRRITLPDGTRLDESAHPLKQFVFDRTGRLFVNVGSHGDDCITKGPITRPCAAGAHQHRVRRQRWQDGFRHAAPGRVHRILPHRSGRARALPADNGLLNVRAPRGSVLGA